VDVSSDVIYTIPQKYKYNNIKITVLQDTPAINTISHWLLTQNGIAIVT